ncbi:MAG: Smr/MutS family protein [Gemmatimonadota bacterium]|jgi:hypothetical protein|nr:Smr/MutS family protein [Gemmatimonadota bacterium]
MTPKRRKPPVSGQLRHPADLLYPTLDLHGLTADEAEALARRWIEARRNDGDGVVRIVTGRGSHSIGPPVLPIMVDELLRKLAGNAVRSFERETGGAVFRVWLNRVRAPAVPVRSPVMARLSEDVLRKAEMALAELGITATPALLEAEARRILTEQTPEL